LERKAIGGRGSLDKEGFEHHSAPSYADPAHTKKKKNSKRDGEKKEPEGKGSGEGFLGNSVALARKEPKKKHS